MPQWVRWRAMSVCGRPRVVPMNSVHSRCPRYPCALPVPASGKPVLETPGGVACFGAAFHGASRTGGTLCTADQQGQRYNGAQPQPRHQAVEGRLRRPLWPNFGRPQSGVRTAAMGRKRRPYSPGQGRFLGQTRPCQRSHDRRYRRASRRILACGRRDSIADGLHPRAGTVRTRADATGNVAREVLSSHGLR